MSPDEPPTPPPSSRRAESSAAAEILRAIAGVREEGERADPELMRELASICAHAQEEREQLARLIDVLPVMIIVYDPSLASTPTGAIRVNRAFSETLGWTPDDASTGNLMELCYPDPEIRAMAVAHMERSGNTWLEIPARAKDGRTVPVRWGNVRLAGDRQVGVGVDLTDEQVRAADRERLLRELAYERGRLSKVFEQAPLFMAMMRGPQHVLERVNAAYLSYYGDRPQLGRPIAEALPELVANGRVALLDRVLVTGEPFIGAGLPLMMRRSSDGEEEERFADMIYVPLTEGDGTRSGVVAIGSDATARVLAERKLRAALDAADLARRHLEGVLSAIPVGVAVIEAPSGRRIYLNDALRRLHGGDAGIRGIDRYKDDWRCFHPRRNGEPGPRIHADELPLARAMRSGETVVDEPMILERADGELRMTSVSAAPIRDAGDAIVGAVAIARDTEDEHRARKALDEARRSAEEANHAKTQFLANMSHELRTPLNAIAGHTQLLEMELHGPVTEAQADALARIQRAQRHLLGLINDVLNFAKLQSGSVEYDVRALDVRDVLADVTAMVEPLLLSKQLRLVVNVPDDAPRVWGDREKLLQILLNLMSNAVKFTPTGDAGGTPPVIAVSLVARDEVPDEVYVRVKDPGVGIARERHESIFDPFVQVRADLTRAHEGTGLGLAISRNLARGMGGRLRVRSEVGAGAAFTVVLRRVIAADGAPTDRRIDDERRSGQDRRRVFDRRDRA